MDDAWRNGVRAPFVEECTFAYASFTATFRHDYEDVSDELNPGLCQINGAAVIKQP